MEDRDEQRLDGRRFGKMTSRRVVFQAQVHPSTEKGPSRDDNAPRAKHVAAGQLHPSDPASVEHEILRARLDHHEPHRTVM